MTFSGFVFFGNFKGEPLEDGIAKGLLLLFWEEIFAFLPSIGYHQGKQNK